MPSPAVSVLIAAYNAEPFIERAIASALDQTLSSLEVVVVDDGSSDDTVRKVRHLGKGDSRLRVVQLETNGGAAVARNAGIESARGDWVAVLDADDAFTPDRLARLLSLADRTGADVVTDNFHLYDAVARCCLGTALSESAGEEPIDRYTFLAKARPFADSIDWGLLKPMYSRHYVMDSGIRYSPQARHGQDFLFIAHLLLHGARCHLTRMPGYLYTLRQSGFSRTPINYDAMAQQTEELLELPIVLDDAELQSLIRGRVAAVRRWSAVYKLQRLKRQRDYAGMLRLLAGDREAAKEIARRVLKFLQLSLTGP